MSKRSELEQQVRDLREELADAEREVLEVSGANGRLGARIDEVEAERDAAWKRVGELERQVTDRDGENAALAEAYSGLIIALGVLGIGDLEAEAAS